MTKTLTMPFVVLLVGFGRLIAQDISTDYPILKEGAFANRIYPAAPIMASSATGDRRKTFRLINGVFRPAFNKDGYIERTGAYLTKVETVDVTGDGKKEGIAFCASAPRGKCGLVWGLCLFNV